MRAKGLIALWKTCCKSSNFAKGFHKIRAIGPSIWISLITHDYQISVFSPTEPDTVTLILFGAHYLSYLFTPASDAAILILHSQLRLMIFYKQIWLIPISDFFFLIRKTLNNKKKHLKYEYMNKELICFIFITRWINWRKPLHLITIHTIKICTLS